jgi:hypothetical protein
MNIVMRKQRLPDQNTPEFPLPNTAIERGVEGKWLELGYFGYSYILVWR